MYTRAAIKLDKFQQKLNIFDIIGCASSAWNEQNYYDQTDETGSVRERENGDRETQRR